MVNKAITPSQDKIVKPKSVRESAKKMIVLFSMILIGLLLIMYKSNYEYWSDQFITFNKILFGVSILLLVMIIAIAVMDFKRIIKHELLGFIIFLIGALILVLGPTGNYLGLGSLNESSSVLFAVGGIIIVISTIILMRTGGFLGVCLFSVIINTLVSAFYMFVETEAIQYNSNVLILINLSIVFFIISFILLIYHDVKFFYLAKIIQDERAARGKKKYNEALKYCDKAIRIYPYFATAWNNKGNVLINMGKKKDALKCYKKALKINPDYMPAKKNIQLIQAS